jgi:uncharacterized membrane protein YphA (DoxX/SURF4 family)
MTQWKSDPPDPDLVDAVMEWLWTWPIARSMLTWLFIVAAIVEIEDFRAAVVAKSHLGMYPPAFWAVATIIAQITGLVIIISGRRIWLGAGIPAVFTAATNAVAHRFSDFAGQAIFDYRNEFCEHLGLVGGFVLVAVLAEERQRIRARVLPGSFSAPPD